MSPGSNGLFHIPLHQPHILQSLSQYFAYFQMNMLIGHTRFGNLNGFIIRSQHNIINLFLALCKFSAHRNSPCKIRTIIGDLLGTGIREHQTSSLQYLTMVMIMKRFSML